jgi:hypothetical protein
MNMGACTTRGQHGCSGEAEQRRYGSIRKGKQGRHVAHHMTKFRVQTRSMKKRRR